MCLQRVWSLIRPRSSYFLRARLDGHRGPINCFAIIGESELLASGGRPIIPTAGIRFLKGLTGDDECVNIWDLNTFQRNEALTDSGGCWGQITCMIWVSVGNGGLLCWGTGRGRLIVYRRKRSNFTQVLDTQISDAGNSVEAVAFDPNQQRLAVASHNGTVKMFRFSKEGNLATPPAALWTVDSSQAIPRSLQFLNGGEDLIVFHLESGEMFCYDSQTAAVKYSRTFKTAIGNADLDEAGRNIVIDNLNAGFDVYPTGRSIPTHSLELPTTRKHIRGVVFCEKGQSVVGGSDHGQIYLFNLKLPQLNQVLTHGNQSSSIQAVVSASSDERHLIISGSSDNKSQICIWEKPTKRALQRKRREEERIAEQCILFTLIVFNLALAITWKAWFPVFKLELKNLLQKLQTAL